MCYLLEDLALPFPSAKQGWGGRGRVLGVYPSIKSTPCTRGLGASATVLVRRHAIDHPGSRERQQKIGGSHEDKICIRRVWTQIT